MRNPNSTLVLRGYFMYLGYVFTLVRNDLEAPIKLSVEIDYYHRGRQSAALLESYCHYIS